VSDLSPSLSRIAKSGLCAGCGACVAVAPEKISMRDSAGGYLRPVQKASLSDHEENSIANVCPGLSMTQEADGRTDHILWGPYKSVHSGYSTDRALRHHASSGGALSAFVTHLIESGIAKFVLQTGASLHNPLGNEGRVSSEASDIFDAAGSRYAPSSPLADLDDALGRAEPFVFVGKPCDAAALRALARFDPRIDQFVVCIVTFFCAGVPSLRGAEEIVRTMGADPEDVAAFRYRGDGWPGYARADLKNGDALKMSYHDSWGKILTKHLQSRCKICPDGVGGAADIAFADDWHCDEKGYPLFEEEEGRSLIVARTEKGEELLSVARAVGAITIEPVSVDRIASMQTGQVKRKKLAQSRLAALFILTQSKPDFKGFQLNAAARFAGIFANIKSFLGTSRRIVLKKF